MNDHRSPPFDDDPAQPAETSEKAPSAPEPAEDIATFPPNEDFRSYTRRDWIVERNDSGESDESDE